MAQFLKCLWNPTSIRHLVRFSSCKGDAKSNRYSLLENYNGFCWTCIRTIIAYAALVKRCSCKPTRQCSRTQGNENYLHNWQPCSCIILMRQCLSTLRFFNEIVPRLLQDIILNSHFLGFHTLFIYLVACVKKHDSRLAMHFFFFQIQKYQNQMIIMHICVWYCLTIIKWAKPYFRSVQVSLYLTVFAA